MGRAGRCGAAWSNLVAAGKAAFIEVERLFLLIPYIVVSGH